MALPLLLVLLQAARPTSAPAQTRSPPGRCISPATSAGSRSRPPAHCWSRAMPRSRASTWNAGRSPGRNRSSAACQWTACAW